MKDNKVKKYYLKNRLQDHYLKRDRPDNLIMVHSLKDATQFTEFETDEILVTWSDAYKKIEVK